MKKIFCLIMLLSALSEVLALEIVYEERNPYVKNSKQGLAGLVATPLLDALHQADISYELNEKPSTRHLYEIKLNQKPLCAIGWYKNPQREAYAKFSKPLYEDTPLGVIARIEDKQWFENININALLQQKNRLLLTKASYSYGKNIDKKMKQFQTKRVETYSSNANMVELIEKKRADYMFSTKEEAQTLLKNPKYKNLKFFTLKQVRTRNKLYLICSKKVSNNILSQLNVYLE